MAVTAAQTLTLSNLAIFLAVGYPVSLCLVFLIQLMQAKWKWKQAAGWGRDRPFLFLAGGVLTEALMLLIAAVTGSFAAGMVIGGLLLLLLGYINFLMVLYRDQALIPRDLAMALNLRQLAAMISPMFLGVLVLVLAAATAAYGALSWVVPPVEWPVQFRQRVTAACVLLLSLFLSLGLSWNPLRKGLQKLGSKGADFDSCRINPYGACKRNGFLLAFCAGIGMPLMERPPGYGKAAVEEIAERYAARAGTPEAAPKEGDRPDIIFIMSEAFSDPASLPGLSFSSDPIALLRKRMEAASRGRALAPGYGGGTAHCEFEALTGFSVALCGGASPFEGVVARRESFPALPGTLRQAGYRATALHPYTDKMYARPKAYRAMGFEAFITQEQMKHRDKLENSPYLSDRAAYEEVLELLESGGNPHFIHLVTMQNHGEYPPGRYRNTIRARGLGEKHVRRFLETYAQGLCYTDQATEWFLCRLERRSRPAVVVFWGDHLPGGYPGEALDRWGLQKFETPFFLWSTGGNAPRSNGVRSPLFFRRLLAEQAGLAKTPLDVLLADLEKEVHGIHMDFYVDANDRYRQAPPPRGGRAWRDYQLLQYDAMEGEGYSVGLGFYEPPR